MMDGFATPNGPEQAFLSALDMYDRLIRATMDKGYTKDQAIELLKVYMIGSSGY